MFYKLQAFFIIGCGVGIAASIMFSIVKLFQHSPWMGIVGCVCLATSGRWTLKALS